MANPVRPSYRLNLNRNPTRKWAEAQQVDYGGDDWGESDDEYDDYGRYGQPEPQPVSAGPQRHPAWDQRGGQVAQRSFTNPPQSMGPGRLSFDREQEEHHYFSRGSPDHRYQTQPSSAPYSQYGAPEQSTQGQAAFAPLHVQTQMPRPLAQSTAQSNPRVNQHTDAYGVPYSAPVDYSSQRLQSDNRAGYQEPYGSSSRQSQQYGGSSEPTTARAPRSGSFGQQQSPSMTSNHRQPEITGQSHAPSKSIDDKPLPFIRPADIYKRVDEEREKERRSQDSSRPSIDSGSGAISSSPNRFGDMASPKQSKNPAQEDDTSRNTKPVLDTVAERRSEYGNSPTSSRSAHPPDFPHVGSSANAYTGTQAEFSSTESGQRPQPAPRFPSSVYTDRTDPVSATSPTSPYATAFGSTRSPISESFRHGIPQYSPSTRKPSGLRPDFGREQTEDDLPNFDHAISPSHSITSETISAIQADSLRARADSANSPSEMLKHQPSLGYKSAVDQAFDAGNNSVLSPSSTNDTLPRSNSNSTSDISPIIARKSGFGHDRSPVQSTVPKTVPEEPFFSHDRSESTATIKPTRQPTSDDVLPATTFAHGYRRDNSPPHTEENKARRPLSVEIPSVPEPQHGIVSTVTAPSASSAESTNKTLSQAQDTPIASGQHPYKESTSQSELVPPASSRSASEDYQEWQVQRRQFNAKHGIDDSNAVSPAISSPVSRAESPVKGTVRDIAGRIESNSGRSSPLNASTTDGRAPILDKPLNTRNESFRPALPGGWLSYTTEASSSDNMETPTKPPQSQQHLQSPLVQQQSRTESSESIPTAVAPRNWKASAPGPMESAFAAAAAAGTAMAGAFSGPKLTPRNQQYSDVSSEDDELSDVSQPLPPVSSETRDFASVSPEPGARPAAAEVTNPSLHRTSHDESRYSSLGDVEKPTDFPAPLRTGRLGDNKQPSPRLSIPVFPPENEQDPEQLQHDIVQSLTPKGSNIDSATPKAAEANSKVFENNETLLRNPSTASDNYDILPSEYSSYWNEREPVSDQKRQTPQGTTERSMAPANRPPIPVMNVGLDSDEPVSKPFLDTRYSWETPLEGRNKDLEPKSSTSAFPKGTTGAKPPTPTQGIDAPPSTISPLISAVHKADGEDSEISESRDLPATTLPARPAAASSFPVVKNDFRNVLNLQNPSQRIRAFEENRHIYAEPNGLLEQWLSSMNTPEHADVFNASRLPRTHLTTGPAEIRPSPRRDTTSASGTKQMQEDGKRLLAAAGKYSGKAGTVAKGFFSKQKDKLRTASSGEKAHSRRKSSSTEISTVPTPRSNQSILSEKPPQLPTPSLETPPERSWTTLLSNIDPSFSDRPQQPTTSSSGKTISPSSTRGQFGAIERPPPSVLAALPGDNTPRAKSQGFPDFDAAAGTGHDTAGLVDDKRADRGMGAMSKLSTENDRFTAPPRADSLPVPHQRRPSTISDVSEISVVPDETSDVVPRNVSPALENQARGQRVPAISAQSSRKAEEAQRDRDSVSEGTLPAYSSINTSTDATKQPRIAPGSQIVPVADLRSAETGAIHESNSRPFSFTGSETLNHAISQQADLKARTGAMQPPANSMSTRADVEKTPQLSITEHPAYRNDDQAKSLSESENVLPSSRRPPQDLEQARQRQQIIVPSNSQAEEGYRIPGPYVRELRSPRTSKPTLSQDSTQKSYEDFQHSPAVSNAQQNRLSGVVERPEIVAQSSQIEDRSGVDRNKGRPLSGIFRTSSKSPHRREHPERSTSAMSGPSSTMDEGKQRRGLFGLSNRPSSPTRQMSSERGGYGTTPDAAHGRKLSFDMLRPSVSSSRPQTDNKKKRSSGLGGFFGRFGSREKDIPKSERSPAPPMSPSSPQPTGAYNQQAPNRMQYPASAADYHHNTNNTRQDPYAQHAQHAQSSQPYTDRSQVVAGQYGMPATIYGDTTGIHGSPERRLDHGQAATTNWQDAADRPQIYANPPNNNIAAVPRPSQPTQAYQTPTEPTVQTAFTTPPVPVTRANRDISYGQDRPYIPPSSPRSKAVSSPVQSKTEIADHVKNLHTRSRSPRLGRPPSDEHLRGAQSEQAGSNPAQNLSNQLGVFNNRKLSPDGGGERPKDAQETPWAIGLPDDGEDVRKNGAMDMRGRSRELDRPGAVVTTAGNNPISPATPYGQVQHNSGRDIVSPVTAIESKRQDFGEISRAKDLSEPARITSPTSRHHEAVQSPSSRSNPVEQLPVPPSISSAASIPNPRARPQGSSSMPDTIASPDTYNTTSPTAPTQQSSRGAKQVYIDHVPDAAAATKTAAPIHGKPTTVAEKVMGIQPTARGTIPEHRSTTPVPKSPAPSIGTQPRTTTWPDERPSTAAITTTNNSGTTVTTTTMRAGSKLGRGSVKTNTYLVDSNTPSRASSNAVAAGNRNSTVNPVAATSNTAAPLTPTAANVGGNRGVQSSVGSKRSADAPSSAPQGKTFEAIELPGSRPEGYESEEEIVMSATAYPGQEWMPDYAVGSSWDD